MDMYADWLNTQFKMSPNRSKSALAESLGLEPSAVSKILNGTRQVKAHEYNVMRKFFGLPVDGEKSVKALSESGYIIKPLDNPSHGLSDPHQNTQKDAWVIPQNILKTKTTAQSDQVRIFKVEEALMEPEYRMGSHVLVDLSKTIPSPAGTFIISDGFGHLLRDCEMVPHSKPPTVIINAKKDGFMPQTIALNDFKIVGKVIAKLQWV